MLYTTDHWQQLHMSVLAASNSSEQAAAASTAEGAAPGSRNADGGCTQIIDCHLAGWWDGTGQGKQQQQQQPAERLLQLVEPVAAQFGLQQCLSALHAELLPVLRCAIELSRVVQKVVALIRAGLPGGSSSSSNGDASHAFVPYTPFMTFLPGPIVQQFKYEDRLQTLKRLEQEDSAALNALGTDSMVQLLQALCSSRIVRRLPQQCAAFVDSQEAQLPLPYCCNNPGCSNLGTASELTLVRGHSCRCTGCGVARYCGRACQVSLAQAMS
jgi:hypothetical protein